MTVDTRVADAPARPTPKPGILDISPYVGGKSKAAGFEHPLKLSSNENVLGCSPLATAAFHEASKLLNVYPDQYQAVLREAVATKFGLEPERLIFGCGSDELFYLLSMVYLQPGDNIVQAEFGFSAYRLAARACQAEVRYAPEPNLVVDVDQMLAQVDERTRIVFLGNPDNPTGTWIGGDAVRRLHEGLRPDVILVLDHAYTEFATAADYDDGIELARTSQNVVVTRTFSKIHGLAGLRVGWGYAPQAIVAAVDRIRPPFNVNVPAQAAAVAALGDDEFVARSVALIETWRPWLVQQLGGIGLEVAPSQANFILVRFPKTAGKTAAEAEAFLAERGVIVRGLANYGLGDRLRITIGLEEHNRRVVDILADFMRA